MLEDHTLMGLPNCKYVAIQPVFPKLVWEEHLLRFCAKCPRNQIMTHILWMQKDKLYYYFLTLFMAIVIVVSHYRSSCNCISLRIVHFEFVIIIILLLLHITWLLFNIVLFWAEILIIPNILYYLPLPPPSLQKKKHGFAQEKKGNLRQHIPEKSIESSRRWFLRSCQSPASRDQGLDDAEKEISVERYGGGLKKKGGSPKWKRLT